jgi:hypothetical protein
MSTRLTQKQDIFCRKYFELGNATKAALIAGYSKRSIRSIASINLTKDNIIRRIEGLRKLAEEASVAKVLERKQVLTDILRGRLANYMSTDGELIAVDEETYKSAALQEIRSTSNMDKDGNIMRSVVVRVRDPIPAIAELNKLEGSYAPQRYEHTGKDGGPIEIDHRAMLISRIHRIVERKGKTDVPEQLNGRGGAEP